MWLFVSLDRLQCDRVDADDRRIAGRVTTHLRHSALLEVVHGLVPDSQEVAAHGFQVMGDLDLSDPNPPAFITFWLYSHPPLAERLLFARAYDPWSKGEPPKYVK